MQPVQSGAQDREVRRRVQEHDVAGRRHPATRVAGVLVVSVLLTLGLAACGGGSSDSRERAVEQSRDAFETARHQGHDMKRAPCIYYRDGPDGRNSWFAVVVFPGDASPRAVAVASGCPGARTLGYVALNESGEVIEVRGIPEG